MSILNVNKINPVGSGSTVTIAGIASVTNNISVGNSVTASSFHGSGANLTGLAGGDTALGLNDGVELKLGSSDDLKLWHHSGGNSYIKETGGGSLVINADDFYLQNNATTTFLRTHSSGSIDLNFGGNKKFETTNSGAIVTGICTATSFAPTEGQLSHRNIIINGAMKVAQYTTGPITTDGFTVDRFRVDDGGQDEAPTREQGSVTGGGAYDAGFRKCLKITNGNQTGGADSQDYVQIVTRLEAQDIANSGWNFPSTSSFITLSFWIKSSVAQAFSGSLRSIDGTGQSYKFDTPSVSANTWTKVTKKIPGNSNLTFANDTGHGLTVYLYPFIGTNYTTSNSDTETWVAASGGNYANDMTSTWWTTNDATFELTGVQLEVGSVATPFEHRSLQDEFHRCCRYYQKYGSSGQYNTFQDLRPIGHSSGVVEVMHDFRGIPMRSSPTVAFTSGSIQIRGCAAAYSDYPVSLTGNNYALSSDGITHTGHFWVAPTSGSPFVACQGGRVTGATNGAYIEFKAEL